jgi:hypothetical protein
MNEINNININILNSKLDFVIENFKLIKDQNNYFSLQEFEFDINSNMDLLNHTQYFDNSSIYSNIFNKSLPLMNLNVLLSSNEPTILNENLVL